MGPGEQELRDEYERVRASIDESRRDGIEPDSHLQLYADTLEWMLGECQDPPDLSEWGL